MLNFKTWLEAINVPPHMPQQWWKETLSNAQRLESRFMDKSDLIKRVEKLCKEYYCDSPRDVDASVPYQIRKAIRKDDYSSYGLSPLSERMKEYSDYSKMTNMSQYHLGLAKNRLKTELKEEQVREFIDEYIKYYQKDGYHDDALEQIPVEHHDYLKALKNVYSAVFEYIKVLKKMNVYLQTMDERDSIRMNKHYKEPGGLDQPTSNAEETLYHATPFIKEILAQGFKTKEDLGHREVLGGATEGAISFTADFKIAKEIAVAIKEAVYISKGIWNVGHVVKLMKQEGIPMPKDWLNDMKYRSKNSGSHSYYSADSVHHNIKQQAFSLYKHYLSLSDKRYDPLFFGVNYTNFESIDEKNIGVLACRCNMKNITRYLESMEEFRVPIKDITKVMKAIKV